MSYYANNIAPAIADAISVLGSTYYGSEAVEDVRPYEPVEPYLSDEKAGWFFYGNVLASGNMTEELHGIPGYPEPRDLVLCELDRLLDEFGSSREGSARFTPECAFAAYDVMRLAVEMGWMPEEARRAGAWSAAYFAEKVFNVYRNARRDLC